MSAAIQVVRSRRWSDRSAHWGHTKQKAPSAAKWGGAAALCAVAYVLAQPPLQLWFLAPFALLPWFAVLATSTSRQAWLGSLAVGTAAGCLGGVWIPEALRNLGSPPLHAIVATLLCAIWVKGLPFALIGGALHAARRTPAWLQLAVAAVAFFTLELLHSSWRWGVPWALLGHSQWSAPGVAQLAAMGGVPLISGLLAAINTGIALAWGGREGAARLAAALLACWGMLAITGLPTAKWMRAAERPGAPLNLLIVQPNLPRGERWSDATQGLNLKRIGRYTQRVVRAAPARPDAVIWPENLVTTPVDTSPELEAALRDWVDRIGVPVVTGAVRAATPPSPGLYRSSVLWLAPGQGIVAAVDKTRAIPLIESSSLFPGASILQPLFVGPRDERRVQEAESGGSPGNGGRLIPALCYEALYPERVASRRTTESRVIVNLADDSWVAGESVTRQLTAIASFRAIEQRLPLIRVAHGGLSSAIDEFGQTTVELPLDEYASAMVAVDSHGPTTIPERLAVLVLPLATGFAVWWALGRRADRTGR